MRKRTNEQLRLYFAYVKQLKSLDVVKIQLDTKEWVGRLRDIRNARYLLKVLDLELPTRNKHFPDKSPNKIEFCDAYIDDLTHHISFLREVLIYNNIVPFNDKGLECTR